jgi:hypothetical protein
MRAPAPASPLQVEWRLLDNECELVDDRKWPIYVIRIPLTELDPKQAFVGGNSGHSPVEADVQIHPRLLGGRRAMLAGSWRLPVIKRAQ